MGTGGPVKNTRGKRRPLVSRRGRWYAIGATVAGVCFLASPAEAYIDPGSGSYAIQVLIGLVVGAGVGLKMYWRRIMAFLGSRGSKRQKPSSDE